MSKKHYILSADDEPMNQFIIELALSDMYELVCVGDGQQCIDSVRERRPDLILMDAKMPNMGGFDACRLVRANPETADVNIIMISALASAVSTSEGLSAGANAYLSKPFTNQALIELVKSFLDDNQG